MRRREFIWLVGGAAVAWPLAVRAQSSIPFVGVLLWASADEPATQDRLAAFIARMRELGWHDKENIRFDFRWAGRNRGSAIAEARQLVALQPKAIIAGNTVTTQILQKQTDRVPIVFGAASDPLRSGLVTNLAHPGGNVTGFSNFEFSMGGKWLQLLKQVAPSVKRVLVMMQPNNAGNGGLLDSIKTIAHSSSIQISTTDENDRAAVERAVQTFASETDGGLIVLPGPSAEHDFIVGLSLQYKIPGVYSLREQVRGGGLLFYGIDDKDPYRGAANYVDRILKGANPGDLPVQQPTKFQLIINLKTAKALGLTIPQTLLATADEVIE